MQTKDKVGISCDLCTQELKFVFTYYSADFEKSALVQGIKQGVPEKLKSFDWCGSCLNKIKDMAASNYRPTRLASCDICGKGLVDSICHANVDEANVSIVAEADANGIKTGNSTANVNVNRNIIDIITCPRCYEGLSHGVL